MRRITIANKTITENDIYIIAEIGCNHNGIFRKACDMIRVAAECGVNAVKFQKRYNDILFTPGLLAAPYNSENAYGKTYGEHRHALDWFDQNEFVRLKTLAHANDVDFIVTPFESKSAEFLNNLGVDAFKIASCDLKTPSLIHQVVKYGKPIILSTGGSLNFEEMRKSIIGITESDMQLAILHCVSTYPNLDNELNLIWIKWLCDYFPFDMIGFPRITRAWMLVRQPTSWVRAYSRCISR